MKKTAVVICPGRGTYNKDELGYFAEHHTDKKPFLDAVDAYRRDCQQIPVSELDAADKFRIAQHSIGENASSLIYACAMADFQSIDRDQFDIVAVTGNSMGWYLALAAGGATTLQNGLEIVNTMGTRMHREASGGQILFPLCDEKWQMDTQLEQTLSKAVEEVNSEDAVQIFHSIDLGGMAVLAANGKGIKSLLNKLPKTQGRYPFVLPNHGAFHSPLMQEISSKALRDLSPNLLQKPEIPLIDGRGHIWQPYKTVVNTLHDYTFGSQVCHTYNYSKAVEVACKEFAPDHLIILGPGSTLGAPTAQQLIKMGWHDLASKDDFKKMQEENPFVLSMGIKAQRQKLLTH